MGTNHPSLLPEIGPDGIAREAPAIAYTEKIIEEEQLQLKRYIKENYSKIREVERELENLTLDMKLTAGPKKAALEHLRKMIELSNERIRAARLKEDETRKAWEASAKAVKDEEAIKQKLCEDLNQLVQEGATAQFSRLEELKRRLEALNPSRASIDVYDGKLGQPTQNSAAAPNAATHPATDAARHVPENTRNHSNDGNASNVNSNNQQLPTDGEGKGKKRALNLGREKVNIIPKAKGGWTGSGFDVDGRT